MIVHEFVFTAICEDCDSNHICVAPYTCVCPDGWMGSDCMEGRLLEMCVCKYMGTVRRSNYTYSAIHLVLVSSNYVFGIATYSQYYAGVVAATLDSLYIYVQ